MRVLITGSGRSGSWQIRGMQIGEAIGAAVIPHASERQCREADLVVVVKRTGPEILESVRRSGRPWVWDMVDAWPQPLGQSMEENRAKRWLRQTLKAIEPHAVIWPTGRAQADGQFPGPQAVIPHHAWPKYSPRPLRVAIESVGYEGGDHYLGTWANVLRDECELRGWRFVSNGDLADCDVGVALRACGGYPARAWKSNVKLANLQALGVPALCSPESGYQETAAGCEWWIESTRDLVRAFDALEPLAERERCREIMLAARYSLEAISATYRAFMEAL